MPSCGVVPEDSKRAASSSDIPSEVHGVRSVVAGDSGTARESNERLDSQAKRVKKASIFVGEALFYIYIKEWYSFREDGVFSELEWRGREEEQTP